MTGSADLLGLQARERSLRELPATARGGHNGADVAHPMREARRSEPVSSTGHCAAVAARAARLSAVAAHLGAENVAPGTGPAPSLATARRSRYPGQGLAPTTGRLGLRPTVVGGPSLGPSPRATAAAASARPVPGAGTALGDITNVVHANRGLSKSSKPITFLQPPQPAAAVAPPPAPLPALPALPAQHTVKPASAVLQAVPPLPTPVRREEPVVFNTPFEGDAQDIQRVSEYAAEVFAQLFQDEAAQLPRPEYMENQVDINSKMRAILIDWLVEVHMKYRLRPETLFLTVNIIDRYLSVRPVMRKRLQLLGVVAMFIAAKFEEIDPPKVGEFAYITDNTYSKTEILNMECTVLVALNFQIAVPTPAHFLDRLQRANGCDGQHRALAQYACELALLDIRMLRHPPSMLVAAALMLSNELLGRQHSWPAAMAHHARRSEGTLRTCAEELRSLLETAPRAQLQAVRRKYQHEHNSAVANLGVLRTRE